MEHPYNAENLSGLTGLLARWFWFKWLLGEGTLPQWGWLPTTRVTPGKQLLWVITHAGWGFGGGWVFLSHPHLVGFWWWLSLPELPVLLRKVTGSPSQTWEAFFWSFAALSVSGKEQMVLHHKRAQPSSALSSAHTRRPGLEFSLSLILLVNNSETIRTFFSGGRKDAVVCAPPYSKAF